MNLDNAGPRAARLARHLTRAPLWLSKYLWVWPLLAAVMISVVGYWVRNRVETTVRLELASRLQTVLNADVIALHLLFAEQQRDAQALAEEPRVRDAILQQLEFSRKPALAPAALADTPASRALASILQPMVEAQNYLDYVVISPERRVIASPYRTMLNRPAPAGYEFFLKRALAGRLAVSRPFAPELPDQALEGPTMFVAAPVDDTNGAVVAVLGLRMNPEDQFTRIFSVARMGNSGETYAFDRRGVMLTATRFDDDLKRLGLIPDTAEATATLNLRLLDPGVNLEAGEKSPRPRDQWPLTRMAAAAVGGANGMDLKGYRNYRGVKVIGAWAWLSQYEMGVATEVTVEESFYTLQLLRQAFIVLFLLLVLGAAGIFGFTVLVDRLQASLRKNSLTARRLGQYSLIQEIGRGANGMVYRAKHALLRRPVAIKLLSPDVMNDATVARFEHEVQMTSQLTHPNTVAIYDYGRTPEGLFYYAMEFLTGIDLDRLVREFGPQPEGRVIHVLRQVCGSLAEAHSIGLIHRDIKPANVLLTRRSGVCDLVKVLDFGLVKATFRERGRQAADKAIVGTPHFMPPEAIETPAAVDRRSDLYAVGAVGYWLLAGKTLFDGAGVDALLEQQQKGLVMPPSQRSSRQISDDLEAVIMRCLARAPEQRPPDAETLERQLGACASAETWTQVDAENWWAKNLAGIEIKPAATMPEKTLVIAPR